MAFGRSSVARALPSAGDERGHVVAVDLDGVETEGRKLVSDGIDLHCHRTVGLDSVAIDDGDEVVALERCGRHGSLPGRPLLQFAVRQFVEDAGVETVEPQPDRHADGLAEPMAERAADDLDARDVVEGRHRQPRAVEAVGRQFLMRQITGLGQRGIHRDGIVAGG